MFAVGQRIELDKEWNGRIKYNPESKLVALQLKFLDEVEDDGVQV